MQTHTLSLNKLKSHPTHPSLLWHHSSTYPSSQEGQSGDDPLLGNALEDPGCSIQAAHAGSEGGDVEAQQKQETHQGDLKEEGKQTEAGRGWGGVESYTLFSSAAVSAL